MVVIQTYNTRYSPEPWRAWITDCDTYETLESTHGESEAQAIGKLILEFPEHFPNIKLNRIPS